MTTREARHKTPAGRRSGGGPVRAALLLVTFGLALPALTAGGAPPHPASEAGTAARVEASVQVWRALRRLRQDASPRVRAESAVALADLHAPEVDRALREALQRDRVPSVRSAAASSLGRRGGPENVAALQRAQTKDRDKGVRGAAGAALAALELQARRVELAPVEGAQVDEALRAQLRDAIAAGLARHGYSVVARGDAAFRLTPRVLALDEVRDESGLRVEVRASVVAHDPAGKVAAMVEGGARASAQRGAASSAALHGQAMQAAARGIADDLAKHLPRHPGRREP